MAKCEKYLNKSRRYKATYIQEVRTFNICSDDMCDACTPYLESTYCMTWLDENRTICELESIYPIEIENDRNYRDMDLPMVEGLPVLQITCEERHVHIYLEGAYAILFLKEGKIPDKRCVSDNIIYYICKDELIAVACNETERI